MSLSIGIVGLPNVGKSTLFNALTNKGVLIANYPFATIDPSVGVVAVPDERLQRLSAFSNTKKTVPAVIEFVDIAGLVRGASEGEGLGNQFLTHIREVDAIAHVVRIFDNENITHVDNGINPLRDIETIMLELALADLSTTQKRLGSVEREVKQGVKTAIAEEEALKKVYAALEVGRPASQAGLSTTEIKLVKGLQLLTLKPMLFVLNKEAGGHNLDELRDERYHDLLRYLDTFILPYVTIDANIEHDLRELHAEDKEQFRREYGMFDDGINSLIKASYGLLGLISFFTTGVEETRAWTIQQGSLAPEAGGAIHSDFTNKFIRAEVVSTETLLAAGSYAKAREQGSIRTEGKEYLVQDGDVIVFLHS